MAKYAYREIGLPPLIDACSLRLNQKGKYYCTTPNCRASLHTRALQSSSACFVSDNQNDHIDPFYCLKKDRFKPDKYDEKLFDLNYVFDCMLMPAKERNKKPYGEKEIGNYNDIPIRTLKTLYEMCIQFKGTNYNGFLIDDILADKYNYHRYQFGITGRKIVSGTFYKYDSDYHSIYMNYPQYEEKGNLLLN